MSSHPTLAEAIKAKLGPNPIPGAQRRAAEGIGVEIGRFNNWLRLDQEPKGESLEGLREWLGLKSVYDLGPLFIATKLKRAGRRGPNHE